MGKEQGEVGPVLGGMGECRVAQLVEAPAGVLAEQGGGAPAGQASPAGAGDQGQVPVTRTIVGGRGCATRRFPR